MDKEERRHTSNERSEEGSREFENISRAGREGQSPAVAEEGTEEDRKQWEKTRDLHEEAKQVTEKADERHQKEDRDQPEG